MSRNWCNTCNVFQPFYLKSYCLHKQEKQNDDLLSLLKKINVFSFIRKMNLLFLSEPPMSNERQS